jgi:hypothetical protein
MSVDKGNEAPWDLMHKMYAHAVALEPDNLMALIGAAATANLITRDLRPLVAGLERAYARNKNNLAVTSALAMLLSISDASRATEYLEQAARNGADPESVLTLRELIDRDGLPEHWDFGSGSGTR